MRYAFYLGVDLGQSSDFTAFALLEEPVWVPEHFRGAWDCKPGWNRPSEMNPFAVREALAQNPGAPDPTVMVRHLERPPLGTRYPAVVSRVGEILKAPALVGKPVALVVDRSGVGQGPLDYMKHEGLRPIGVTIHGGSKVSRGRDGYGVPKKDLVGAVALLMQSGRLKIAGSLPEAATLRTELSNFRVKQDARTAHESYEHWREGDHDDLVLATAMACWFRQFWNRRLDRMAAEEARNRDLANATEGVPLPSSVPSNVTKIG